MNSYSNNKLSRVKSNPVSFLIDLGISLSASLACLLFVRYQASAIPNFDECLCFWLNLSLISSFIGILLTRVNRIIFTHASFVAVYRVFFFLLIKGILLFHLALLMDFSPDWKATLLAVVGCDFIFTLVFFYIYQLLVILHNYYENKSMEIAVQKSDVLIYGTGPKSLTEAFRVQDSQNFNLIGFITRKEDLSQKVLLDYPVFYLNDNVLPVHSISAVIFTEEEDRRLESDGIVRYASENGIMVMTIPSEGQNYSGISVDEMNQMIGNQYIADNMTSVSRALKRFIDITLSLALIVLSSPAILGLSIILILSEGRPVFFKQERIGRFGKPFNILKFRTMKLDAEAGGPALYSGDNDPRMTKVGKFLRVHHLDELPQLFNIFIGDMSFVGHRPERKVFIAEIIKHDPRYAFLYQMRPGVTSYATIKNGYTDTMEKMLRRLRLDLYYMSHRTLLFDIKIIFDTVVNVVSGKRF